jgi:hypothetical protein
MAEGTKQTAKERASFARADRLKKEAAQQQEPADLRVVITKRGKVYHLPEDAVGIPITEYFPRSKFPEHMKDAKVYETPQGRVIARPERPDEQWKVSERAQTAKKAEAQRGTEQKRDAERKAETVKHDADRKAENQKGAEKRKDDQKREADQKTQQQKQDAAKLDAERQQQRKQEAQKRDAEKKAEAHVAAQFKQQQADQIAEHRRQTSRMRTQHQEQSSSLKSREGEAIDRHWHDVRGIDQREAKALQEFDVKRASLTGRAAELIKGKAHFDGRREEVQKKFESDRLHKHRDLEALKERQFTAQQEQRIRQAKERLGMMHTHREARNETQQNHERDRPRLVNERQRAVERNAEIERSHKQEQKREKGQSMRSEFGR